MNHNNDAALPDPGSDPSKRADAWDQIAQFTSDTLAKLRALPRPAGDEATLDAIFAMFDTVVSDETQLAAALRAGDRTTLQQLQTTGPADLKAENDASNQYGLLC